MSQILKLTHENQQLKRQINQYQQVLGVSPYVNDSLLKGGYRVVKTIVDRDAIKCCWRKQGMKVVVIGEDYSYKEYVLKTSDCNENIWEEINLTVEENEVNLIEDYSTLEENLKTQRDLNLILKTLILQLQQDVQNIEVPTNTSELINDGEDGINPFITALDIPEVILPTKTSDLQNDGEDGINPFITAQDIPAPIPQVNADWNATSGVAQILNKPTIPGPVDISGKLDKPTTDGSWVVTKSGSTITYTSASTFGQNIANTNLTWSADRTQNLNAKKLSFTGGRVSVPALELEITTENSVPNKIWTAGNYLWHTNNLGISYRVAYDNQFYKTISGNVTLDDTYHNCIVRITANCTITVPNTLRADFNCVFDAIGAIIATFVEGSGTAISAPFGKILRDNAMCTLYKYTSNTYRINGGLLPV